mmetsp:Transcript_24609/g.44251  ORF Transcript_24609/g.44251 Transcript_24609/m.44251 type:complete len:469 (-) Transcript_24609:1230-2636(-)
MKPTPSIEYGADPINFPPRSRLFLVVPKQCDVQRIQTELSHYPDFEFCKTDLAASKGVVFCKFYKASSALKVLEDINFRGMIADYKVKCMLAEPMVRKQQQPQSLPTAPPRKIEFGIPSLDGLPFKLQAPTPSGIHEYQVNGLGGPNFVNSFGMGMNVGLTGNMGANVSGLMGSQIGSLSVPFGPSVSLNGARSPSIAPPGAMTASNNNVSGLPTTSPLTPLSKQRLFVVVNKNVTEDTIARLFRRFPGMEYCDLKKDKFTGTSKGFCYVNYSLPHTAAAVVETLNGVEFPPNSGHHIKVMFAEPLGVPRIGNGVVGNDYPPSSNAPHNVMNGHLHNGGSHIMAAGGNVGGGGMPGRVGLSGIVTHANGSSGSAIQNGLPKSPMGSRVDSPSAAAAAAAAAAASLPSSSAGPSSSGMVRNLSPTELVPVPDSLPAMMNVNHVANSHRLNIYGPPVMHHGDGLTSAAAS